MKTRKEELPWYAKKVLEEMREGILKTFHLEGR